MGKKGTPHRKWSKEEKMVIVKKHLDEHISIKEIEKEAAKERSEVIGII